MWFFSDTPKMTTVLITQFALQARDLGVDYVGICCGAGPHHVRAMAEALGREVPASHLTSGQGRLHGCSALLLLKGGASV